MTGEVARRGIEARAILRERHGLLTHDELDRLDRQIELAYESRRKELRLRTAEREDEEWLSTIRCRNDIALDSMRERARAEASLHARQQHLHYPRVARSWLAAGALAFVLASAAHVVDRTQPDTNPSAQAVSEAWRWAVGD